MITGIKNRCPGAIQRIADQARIEKLRHPEEPYIPSEKELDEIAKALAEKKGRRINR